MSRCWGGDEQPLPWFQQNWLLFDQGFPVLIDGGEWGQHGGKVNLHVLAQNQGKGRDCGTRPDLGSPPAPVPSFPVELAPLSPITFFLLAVAFPTSSLVRKSLSVTTYYLLLCKANISVPCSPLETYQFSPTCPCLGPHRHSLGYHRLLSLAYPTSLSSSATQ